MKLIIENWNKFLSEEEETEEEFSQLERLPDNQRAIESLKQAQEILLSLENDPSIDDRAGSVFETALAFAIMAAGGRATGLGEAKPISSFPWFRNLKLLMKDRIRRFENGSFEKPSKQSEISFDRTQNKILSSLKSTLEKFFSFSEKIGSWLFKENLQQHREMALEILLDDLKQPDAMSIEKFEKYKQKLKETQDPKTIKMIEEYLTSSIYGNWGKEQLRKQFRRYYAALSREYTEKFTGDLNSRLKEILLILRSDEFENAYVEDLAELVSDLISETSLDALSQGF